MEKWEENASNDFGGTKKRTSKTTYAKILLVILVCMLTVHLTWSLKEKKMLCFSDKPAEVVKSKETPKTTCLNADCCKADCKDCCKSGCCCELVKTRVDELYERVAVLANAFNENSVVSHKSENTYVTDDWKLTKMPTHLNYDKNESTKKTKAFIESKTVK